MRRKKIPIVIIFLISYAGTCKKNLFVERVYSIKVINNSSERIIFFDRREYPDTLLPINKPYYFTSQPDDFAYIDSKVDWPDVFSQLPNDTLSIFILSSDTVNANSWDIIRSEYKILKRYDLSFQELENKNFTITYP